MAEGGEPPGSRPRAGTAPWSKATWAGRLQRAWQRPARGAAARRRLEAALDAWLRDIDFEEVTLEDRIAFIESVVTHRVRHALARGRLDLVPHLCSAGIRKAGEVGAGAGPRRPGARLRIVPPGDR